jgi:putative spermidine/putrescine transport system permease protein
VPKRWTILAAGALLAVLVAVVVLPLAVVVVGSVFETRLFGLSSESWSAGAGSRKTWFPYVLGLYGSQIGHSAMLAGVVVLASFLIGAPAAYGLEKNRGLPRRLLRAALDAPLAVPGLAVAVGLILAYPRARASGVTLAAGHLLYALPFFVRATGNALASFPLAELEEAAAATGAGKLERLRRVVLPLARPGLLAGALMAFTISWGEFNVSFLLATPTTQTFPSALYLTYTTNSFPVAAAATTIFLAAAVPALALLHGIARPEAARFGEAA